MTQCSLWLAPPPEEPPAPNDQYESEGAEPETCLPAHRDRYDDGHDEHHDDPAEAIGVPLSETSIVLVCHAAAASRAP